MVSTGRCRSVTNAVVPNVTRIAPGIFLAYLRHSTITAMESSEIVVAGSEMVCHARPYACMRWKKSPGMCSICKPKKSRICVLAIRIAMPFVKPMTTGRGKYFTAVPMPVAPSSTRITPAIMVQTNRPSTPNFVTIPATTTTNAPVGPPICVLLPPSAETMNPVTMAQ